MACVKGSGKRAKDYPEDEGDNVIPEDHPEDHHDPDNVIPEDHLEDHSDAKDKIRCGIIALGVNLRLRWIVYDERSKVIRRA